jgi:hypothetical protein
MGLALGICSAALYKWFFIYASVSDSLIAHGSALFIYYSVCSGLAIAGLILGLAGSRWIRQSAMIVSLVMVFQSLELWEMRTKVDVVLALAMFTSLAILGIISLGCRYFISRAPQLEVKTQ